MHTIFLHGGGDHVESRASTFGRFVQALRPHPSRPLLLVVAEARETDRETSLLAYRAIFQAIGLSTDVIAPAFVTPAQPLTAPMLMHLQPCGVFVCGGTTPFYREALCIDRRWVAYLNDTQIPYGGTSAGAAIAAQSAILGGWQAQRAGQRRAILFSGASEGLDQLTVQPGLGLVPFAVDVHASQLGTLLRLIHAVDLGLVPNGWAIDEDTLLEVADHGIHVYGRGQAYAVERTPADGIRVTIHAGAE